MDSAEHAAFSEELLRHVDRLYRFARLLTRDPTWAEDLVQQTVLRAYEKADQLRSGGSCSAWLSAILRNLYLAALRRQRSGLPDAPATERYARVVEEDLYPLPLTPETLLEQELSLEALERALEALPGVYREVLILVDLDGLTYEEVAVVTGCAIGTVKSRLYRARNRLKGRLSGFAAAEPLARRTGR